MDNDFINGIIISYTKILKELKVIKEEIFYLKNSQNKYLENLNLKNIKYNIFDKSNNKDFIYKQTAIKKNNIKNNTTNLKNKDVNYKQTAYTESKVKNNSIILNKHNDLSSKKINNNIKTNKNKNMTPNLSNNIINKQNNQIKNINNRRIYDKVEIRKNIINSKKKLIGKKQNEIVALEKTNILNIKKKYKKQVFLKSNYFEDLGN